MGYLKIKFKCLFEKIEDRIEGEKEFEINDDWKVFVYYMVCNFLVCFFLVR